MTTTISGGAVGRMRGTIKTCGIFAIDVVLFGEDQMTTDGTLIKAEVPMTHLESLKSTQFGFEKRAKGEGP